MQMKSRLILIAAASLLPGQAIAAPLCATLKSVLPVAQKDKSMAALKTTPGNPGSWLAAKQIDGFKCVITTGGGLGSASGFYSCTWAGANEAAPVQQTIDAIGKCFAVAPQIEKKSYTTTVIFDLQAAPKIEIATNHFTSGEFSFSLIAE